MLGGGALTNFPCKLSLIFFFALGEGAPTAPPGYAHAPNRPITVAYANYTSVPERKIDLLFTLTITTHNHTTIGRHYSELHILRKNEKLFYT